MCRAGYEYLSPKHTVIRAALVSLTTDEDAEDNDDMSFRRRQWTTDERVTDEHRRERRQQRSTSQTGPERNDQSAKLHNIIRP
ncbi:hypothetical protein J8273_8606 [Carpediemonas membranifera]|uniref:Uncharacterized protein n=1 Tax=Carpediemonas membranifera TaxID=201153 RepID=A0A8J6DXD3_9EUKA|nr:hypothetical protein J8273_8606 [Carpediemonas membranifera]|eukprot:KAG9389919.1 hypothetical protein J8273_8606 [Carpediemonas membranifera]